MTTNCIEQIGEGVFVTNLFWICNCEEDFLCINGLGKCPHCGKREKDAASTDISLILKHALELPKNRVNELIESMMAADENKLCLVDMLTTIATDNGFVKTDGTNVLFVLTI